MLINLFVVDIPDVHVPLFLEVPARIVFFLKLLLFVVLYKIKYQTG